MRKTNQEVWKSAFEKGSKKMQSRLQDIHKNNPEFQEFMHKHGFGGTLSVKQASKQQKSSVASVKPVTKDSPEKKKGPTDRLELIRQAADKAKYRRQMASNRAAFGGELGGTFQMPGGAFRRYSESLDSIANVKIDEMKESAANRERVLSHDSAILPGKVSLMSGHKTSIKLKIKKLAKALSNVQRKKLAEALQKGKTEHSGAKKGDGAYWGRKIEAKRDSNKQRRKEDKKLSKEELEMATDPKNLQELKKTTLASYVKKAARNVRTATKLGTEMSPVIGAAITKKWKAEDEGDKIGAKEAQNTMDAGEQLEKVWKNQARKRISGIEKATNRLASDRVPGATRYGKKAKFESVEDSGEFGSLGEEINSFAKPDLWNTHMLKHESGKELKKGDVVKDFRGDKHTIKGFELPHHEGSTGRVHTSQGVFFPGVVDARIVKRKGVKEESEASHMSLAEKAKALYKSKARKDVETPADDSNADTETTTTCACEEAPTVSSSEIYRRIRESKARKNMGVAEGTTGGSEPDSRGWTPKPAKGFSGKHTLGNMDKDTMPKPKVHHDSGEVINDRSKQHKKILGK